MAPEPSLRSSRGMFFFWPSGRWDFQSKSGIMEKPKWYRVPIHDGILEISLAMFISQEVLLVAIIIAFWQKFEHQFALYLNITWSKKQLQHLDDPPPLDLEVLQNTSKHSGFWVSNNGRDDAGCWVSWFSNIASSKYMIILHAYMHTYMHAAYIRMSYVHV